MKKLAKRASVLALAVIMAMSMTMGAFAMSSGESGALKAALKNAGLDRDQVKYVESEYDDGIYEVEFTKKSNGAEYGYEYKKKSGKYRLMEKSVDYNRKIVKGAATLTKSEARSKVAKFSGIKKSTVSNGATYKKKDDGQYYYEIIFKTSTWRYEYDVHARTGKILEYEKNRR